MNPKSTVPGYLFAGVGCVLIVIGLYWGVIAGYYQHELPVLIGIVVVGMLLAWFGQRLLQTAKRSQIEHRIAQRDAEGKK